MMELFNPDGVAPPRAAYSHGAFVPAGTDLLFISGQVGIRPDGEFGDGFAEQVPPGLSFLVNHIEWKYLILSVIGDVKIIGLSVGSLPVK